MAEAQKLDVFGYRNYRQFLADYYRLRKNTEYGFSYRRFARTVGLRSPNYLKLVAEGARNLTSDMAARFAEACGLKGEGAAYFCDLVAFNQAGSEPERERCYERLRGHRRYRNVFKLDSAHARYHGHWYIPAIRELAASPDFRAEPKWIARRLRPRIAPRDAQRALDVLSELGLLAADDDGVLRQSQPLLSTGEGPLGHHIVSYHRAVLERAAEALELFSREEREFGALTLRITQERFESIKHQLYALRQQLLQDSADDTDATLVVQLNMQLFPLTTRGNADE